MGSNVTVEGRVGPIYAQDGVEEKMRLTREGAQVMQDMHGRFYEAVFRGTVFEACTATSGVAPGTSISTTGAFTLFNPVGSGKNLVLIDASFGYVSGTIGSGQMFLCGSTNLIAAAVTGTAITPTNLLLGGAANPVGKAFTTSTLPAAPTVLRPVWVLAPFLATTVFQPVTVREVLDGKYIVQPGAALTLHSVAGAGTSPLITLGMSWEEVSI